MRILIIIGSNGIGGAEKQAFELTKYLNNFGHDAQLIFLRNVNSINNQKEPRRFYKSNFNFINFNFPVKQYHPQYFINLVKLFIFIKKNKFDIIHSFLPEAVFLISLYKCIVTDSMAHVAGVRGEYFKKFGFKEKMYVKLMHKSEIVCCNSNSLQKVCIDKYQIDSQKVRVVTNGIDIPQPIRRTLHNPLRACVIANLQSFKGYDLLFESLTNIEKPLELSIIGRGNFHGEFGGLLSIIPKNVQIKFLGEIEVTSILREFDFAIHPSLTEGLSNSIMEQLAYGLPVIAFNVGGNHELIENEVNGLLICNSNSRSLHEAINKFLTNPSQIVTLAAKTQDALCNNSFEKIAKKLIDVYSEAKKIN